MVSTKETRPDTWDLVMPSSSKIKELLKHIYRGWRLRLTFFLSRPRKRVRSWIYNWKPLKRLWISANRKLAEIDSNRLLRRVIWSLTAVGGTILALFIEEGWVAFGLFVFVTMLHERGRWLQRLHFLRNMNKLCMSLDRKHTYDSIDLVYEISFKGRDVCARKMMIRPCESMVAVKRLLFGAQGEGVGKVRTFEDLNISVSSNKGEAMVFPVVEGNGESTVKKQDHGSLWYGNVILTSPIEATEKGRTIHTETEWRNLWNPLLTQGKDEGSFELRRYASVLQITVVFPHGVKKEDAILKPKGEMANEGHVEPGTNIRGRTQLTWEIQEARSGKYAYDVLCEVLPKLAINMKIKT